jgi:hypothetical protein
MTYKKIDFNWCQIQIKGHWVALKFSPFNIFVETIDYDYITIVDNKVLVYFVA